MWDPPEEHPLRRLFAGLTEHAFFTHLGVADPQLTDYLTNLMTRFLHYDAVYRLRNAAGKPITELVEMVLEAEQLPAGGRTQREYYRHIGDFALFWTGFYPEYLERLRPHHCKDALVSYTVHGKRGYLITSRLEEEERHEAEAGLYRRLSDEFELCALGLRKVRDDWRTSVPNPDTIGP